MAKPSPTKHERAREALANCHERPDGCLIWDGAIDDNGYGYIKVAGKKTLVHRLVALYGIERTPAQVAMLEQYRIKWDCGRRTCLRLSSGHMAFSTSKPEIQYESSEVLDEIASRFRISAGYVV